MIDKDLNKLIDSLDMEEENQEVEYVDDWYCMACDYGPMNEEHDKCQRCDEPHPTMKKQKAVDSAIAVGEAKRRAECGNDCAAAGLDTTLSACMNFCVSPHLLSR